MIVYACLIDYVRKDSITLGMDKHFKNTMRDQPGYIMCSGDLGIQYAAQKAIERYKQHYQYITGTYNPVDPTVLHVHIRSICSTNLGEAILFNGVPADSNFKMNSVVFNVDSDWKVYSQGKDKW